MNDRLSKLAEPSIPSEFIRDALEACKHRDIDTEALLIRAGIDPEVLRISGQRISATSYAKLVQLIITTLDDGFVGFLDDHIPVRSFSVFAAQLAACSNLKQVLQQTNRFYGLFTKQFRIEHKTLGDRVVVRLHFTETQNFDYRFIHQSILLVLVRITNWFIGETIQPLEVRFTFNEANLGKYLGYLFDCPISFESPYNELHYDPAIFSASSSTNLEQVELMLRDSTQMMLISDRPAPFTRRVRSELALRRSGAWPSIDEVTKTMNISKNLLWRKLKKENTSFLGIRDELKRDLAMSLITQPDITMRELSWQLGFADISAFNKAFIKWTGVSPSKYRKTLQLR